MRGWMGGRVFLRGPEGPQSAAVMCEMPLLPLQPTCPALKCTHTHPPHHPCGRAPSTLPAWWACAICPGAPAASPWTSAPCWGRSSCCECGRPHADWHTGEQSACSCFVCASHKRGGRQAELSSHMHSADVTCQTAHTLLVLPHCGAPLPTGPCRRWFMQLLLPVNVYALVHEKEHHLRMMMRMQVGGGRMQGWLAGVPAPALLPAALQQPRKSLRESCSWPWLHLSTHGEEREPVHSLSCPAQPAPRATLGAGSARGGVLPGAVRVDGGAVLPLHVHLRALWLPAGPQALPPQLLLRSGAARRSAARRGVHSLQQGCHCSCAWMAGASCWMHQSRALQGALGLDNILGTLPQVVFYFLWGNLLASWSFYFSSIMKQARTAGGAASSLPTPAGPAAGFAGQSRGAKGLLWCWWAKCALSSKACCRPEPSCCSVPPTPCSAASCDLGGRQWVHGQPAAHAVHRAGPAGGGHPQPVHPLLCTVQRWGRGTGRR